MEARSAVTLKAVTRIGLVLHRLRALALFVGLVGVGWFTISVLDSTTNSTRSLLALSLVLWAGLALGGGFLLVRPPPRLLDGDGSLRRLRKRVLALLFWLGALGFLGLAVFTLLLSLRALRLNFG